jgi:hypothetical protein
MLGNVKYLSLVVFLGLLLSVNQVSATSQQSIHVLDDQVFFALGPSGEELNQTLADNYPEWANYRQDVSWYSEPVTVGKIVREASFQEKFALNSEVALVTLGESLNWQSPSDSDLFLQSFAIGERPNYLWYEWTNPENEEIRAQFPEVTNGASYALYVFFNYDGEKLQIWYDAYQRLFGRDPSQPLRSAFLQSNETTLEPFLIKPFYDPDDSDPDDLFYTVNSFFDHGYPLYDEDTIYPDTLFRFDGMALENAAFNPCTLQFNCYSGHDAYDYNTPHGRKIRAVCASSWTAREQSPWRKVMSPMARPFQARAVELVYINSLGKLVIRAA